MTAHITVKDLADELGLDRSHMRKYLVKNGIPMQRIRPIGARGQQSLALTEEDAARVVALRASDGYGDSAESLSSGPVVGSFYAIQIVPELAPNRIKLGWTRDIAARLAAHHTVAPTAVTLKTWPCRQRWEGAAIDSITANGCQVLSNEVFDCDSLTGIAQRGDAFFAVMPPA